MRKSLAISALVLATIVFVSGCISTTTKPAEETNSSEINDVTEETENVAPLDFNATFVSCRDSGGTVKRSLCCNSTTSFPNMCVIGACGCSSENSHMVSVCSCPEGKCFDGTKCV